MGTKDQDQQQPEEEQESPPAIIHRRAVWSEGPRAFHCAYCPPRSQGHIFGAEALIVHLQERHTVTPDIAREQLAASGAAVGEPHWMLEGVVKAESTATASEHASKDAVAASNVVVPEVPPSTGPLLVAAALAQPPPAVSAQRPDPLPVGPPKRRFLGNFVLKAGERAEITLDPGKRQLGLPVSSPTVAVWGVTPVGGSAGVRHGGVSSTPMQAPLPPATRPLFQRGPTFGFSPCLNSGHGCPNLVADVGSACARCQP